MSAQAGAYTSKGAGLFYPPWWRNGGFYLGATAISDLFVPKTGGSFSGAVSFDSDVAVQLSLCLRCDVDLENGKRWQGHMDFHW